MLGKILQKVTSCVAKQGGKIIVGAIVGGGALAVSHNIAYNSGRKKGHEERMQEASKNFGESFQAAADVLKEL